MVKLSAIKTNPDLENKGVWVEWELGVQLLIARIGNKAFDEMMRRLSEPHLKTIRADAGDKKMEDITKKALAKHILLGGKGIEDDDGKALKYTPEQALTFFNDDSLRDLYKFVLITANESARYRAELDEDGAKN